MQRCTKCGDRFSGEEINEWRHDNESFSTRPFMCPDCYDTFSRQDLENQFAELMGVKASALR